MAGSKACSPPGRWRWKSRSTSRRLRPTSRSAASGAGWPWLLEAGRLRSELDTLKVKTKGPARCRPFLVGGCLQSGQPAEISRRWRQGRGRLVVPVRDPDRRNELELPPSADGHPALAVQDVPPGLFQLVGRHVGDRAVIVAEDRGVERAVLGVAGNDRMARPAVDRDPVDQNLIALRQVVFEVGETANALPPAPPNRHVAPHQILLFVVQ